MTTITLEQWQDVSGPRVPFARAVRAEWTKLRTVRSTWTNIAIAAATSIALAVGLAFAVVSDWDSMGAEDRATFDPTSAGLIGVLVSGLVMGSIAIKSISGEYTSGLIRTTLTAIPSRRRVLAAKAVVIAGAAFPISLVANTLGYIGAQQVFAREHIESSLGDPGVVRAILASALAITLIALTALGLGAAIRHVVGANTVLSLTLIGSQLIGIALPDGVTKYLPGFVLQAMTATKPSGDLLSPAAATAVFITYTAVIYEIGKQRIQHSDV